MGCANERVWLAALMLQVLMDFLAAVDFQTVCRRQHLGSAPKLAEHCS